MHRKTRLVLSTYLASSSLLLLVHCGDPYSDGLLLEETDAAQQQEIINGTVISPENRGVVLLSNCSANLLNNDYLITAEHCGLAVGGSATMGSQATTVDWVVDHPSLDVTIARLAAPMRMNGSTHGYQMPMRRTALAVGDPVVCRGYGRNTYTDGFGTLREATVSVTGVFTDHVRFGANSAGQIAWKGDSGSACLDSLGRSAGVASTCYVVNSIVQSCNYVRADRFANWVDQQIAGNQVHHDIPLTGDLDGDGEDEIIIWRPSTGRWYSKRTDGSRVFAQGTEPSWGWPGDIPLVGDLDNDGADDMVIWRPSTGRWYGLRVNKTRIFSQNNEPYWGWPGDIPLVGNLDGSGGDDLVIWRPATGKWYGLRVDKTRIFPKYNEPYWGWHGDIPLLADLDNDGADDMVIWRPSTGKWYGLRVDKTRVFTKYHEPYWGWPGDIPLVGNLDGTGGEDMVIWRPSTGKWYGLRVDKTRIFTQFNEPYWGWSGDIPLMGDLDEDGADDMVIWRPSTAKWYGLRVDKTRIFPQGSEPSWGIPY